MTDPTSDPSTDPTGRLLALGTATLAESGARPLTPGLPRCGPVRCWPHRPSRCGAAAGDNLAVHHAVASAPAGSALVVTVDAGHELGWWGEVLTVGAQARGLTGLVIDAHVRDTAAIAARRFPVWAQGTALPGATKVTPGSVGAAVSVRGAAGRGRRLGGGRRRRRRHRPGRRAGRGAGRRPGRGPTGRRSSSRPCRAAAPPSSCWAWPRRPADPTRAPRSSGDGRRVDPDAARRAAGVGGQREAQHVDGLLAAPQQRALAGAQPAQPVPARSRGSCWPSRRRGRGRSASRRRRTPRGWAAGCPGRCSGSPGRSPGGR